MEEADWAQLPDDLLMEVSSRLNSCDRASLASTCWSWRKIGSSSFLWQSLDLRLYKFDSIAALSLAPYCANLQKFWFYGNSSVFDAIINLRASNLREIKGYASPSSSVSRALVAIAGRHPALESLELDAYYNYTLTNSKEQYGELIASEEIQIMSLCCSKLRKLKLSRVEGIDRDAIEALSMNCRNLSEIRFMDCFNIDEVALGKVSSLRFLSVAGTVDIDWNLACDYWTKLPNLIGLDLSRTNVDLESISRLLSSSTSLKVLCALECPAVQENANRKRDAKLLVDAFDVCHWFRIVIPNADWGCHTGKDKDEGEIVTWLEYIVSHVLFEVSEYVVASDFWISYAGLLVLRLMLSPQKDVQEMVARVLARLKFDDKVDINARIPGYKSEVVPQYRDKALCFLLELAKSKHEGLQSEAAKALINLCRYPSTWKSFVDQGGVAIFMNLIRSSIKSVAEEAAEALNVLSEKREYRNAFVEAGLTEALLDLITKRSKFVLMHATCALANLATDEKCGRKIARAGGLQALVKLGFQFRNDRVINQVALAIANLFGNKDNNKDPIDVEELCDIVKELDQLTRSGHPDVRGKAVAALLKLCEDEEYIKAFSAASAIETLEVQEIAVGTLDNHVVYAHNLLILQKEVVSALVGVCATTNNNSARFNYALALAYMFDGRSDDGEKVGRRKLKRKGVQNEVRKIALDQISGFILSICDRRKFSATSVSMPVPYLLEIANTLYITDASCTNCSETKIRKLLSMLRDRSFALVAFTAFAIFQFTSPGDVRSKYHRELVQKAGGVEILRDKAASKSSHDIVKVLCKLVLINLNA